MKSSLKNELEKSMNKFLDDYEAHNDRPSGLACVNLGEMMADAAAAVYEASHAGATAGANDPSSCGVSDSLKD